LSASISHKDALEAIRRGERLPHQIVRALGESDPSAFFRIIVEALADSFDPAQAAAYEELMRAWIPPTARVEPKIPQRVETIFVLSRVTLGADIKITSIILDAMKHRFPDAAIVLAGNRKSDQLYFADSRVSQLIADYPRSGSVIERIQFADDLRNRFEAPNRIVIDPDSRMTQLGLIPVCEPEYYFHFPSRTADSNPDSAANLTDLTQHWLQQNFDVFGQAYIAPDPVPIEGEAPRVAVSLGVGDNETKRVGADFESQLIRALGAGFRTIWIDRGVGGEEARRVTAAAEASGCIDRVRFWEGSFAGFASLIAQSDLYVGYDSAGQHAAAASGTPLISIFAGAPSDRFRQRWSPQGPGRIHVIEADSLTPAAVLEQFKETLTQ
jgi:ADP-heptose:LPS heptosyltransferase